VLTPILATDDPYEAAAVFVKAGWSLIFQTPRDSGAPPARRIGHRTRRPAVGWAGVPRGPARLPVPDRRGRL